MIKISVLINSVETFLDMNSNEEFNIEVENPFLNNELLPTPFSTAISFPMTPLNCSVFQYIDAMRFEPGVKKINATLYVDGFQFSYGMLEFDNISEDKLNYIFTENRTEINWEKKLDDSFTITYPILLQEKAGNEDYPIAFPEIIKEGQQGKVVWPQSEVPMIPTSQAIATAEEKYINNDYEHLMPAYRFSALLANCDSQIDYDARLSDIMSQIAILGCGKIAEYPYPYGEFTFDNTYEPDISYKDLLEALCKITCSCVRIKNGHTKILSFDTIFYGSTKNIDKFIDNGISISLEKGKIYILGYQNDGDEVREATDSEKQSHYSGYAMLPSGEPQNGTYYIDDSKDVISSTYYWHSPLSDRESELAYEIADIIAHAITKTKVAAIDSEEEFDESCNMELVKCVPDWVFVSIPGSGRHGGIGYSFEIRKELKPIVPTNESSDRNSNCRIGLIKGRQLVDKDIFIQYNSTTNYSDVSDDISLAPESLFETFHENFSNFITKDKVLLKIHAHMSISELLSIDITDKLNYRGRIWLIKKMTYTFHTMNGLTDCELELLEM